LLTDPPRLVVAQLQQPERFAHDFAGGMVEAAAHLLVDQLFELCRQRHIHEIAGLDRQYQELSIIVKNCYRAWVIEAGAIALPALIEPGISEPKVLKWEEEDAALVGHSYGGFVVNGVAGQAAPNGSAALST
jgi:hypothetical protein